jgi:hypothetical protein
MDQRITAFDAAQAQWADLPPTPSVDVWRFTDAAGNKRSHAMLVVGDGPTMAGGTRVWMPQ